MFKEPKTPPEAQGAMKPSEPSAVVNAQRPATSPRATYRVKTAVRHQGVTWQAGTELELTHAEAQSMIDNLERVEQAKK